MEVSKFYAVKWISGASSRSFFSSWVSSSSRPSFETLTSLWPSNSFNCVTAYSSIGSARSRTGGERFTSKLVDVLLDLRHASDIVYERIGVSGMHLTANKSKDVPFNEVCSSVSLVEKRRKNSASLLRCCESSWIPNLMFLPNAS